RWDSVPPWRSAWCRCWASCWCCSPCTCARTDMVGESTWRRRLLGLWVPLAVFYVVALFPFTWMAATSLKTNAELYDPTAMPLAIRHPSLVHYIDLLRETNFLTWTANTMLVAVVATGISLLLGSMLAFTLAQNEFLYGLLFLSRSSVRTVPIGVVGELIRGDAFYWGQLMAGALLGSIPVALIYSFFVKYYVAGLTAGAVKG